jgi:cytochrome c-type biogenesis protein
MSLTIWIAFLAGLVSFLSPCVLSLVPVYITYLAGRSLPMEAQNTKQEQQIPLWFHAFCFVLGFSLIFIGLGLAASTLGNLLYDSKDWIARIGGILIILFGLHSSGSITIPFLNYELKPRNSVEQNRGYLSSFLMGIFFSAGWSPCIGPVLGAILLLAANSGSISIGLLMLIAYSLGLAIPFLLSTFAVDALVMMIRRYKKIAMITQKAFGIFITLIGLLLFLGVFERFAQFSNFIKIGY